MKYCGFAGVTIKVAPPVSIHAVHTISDAVSVANTMAYLPNWATSVSPATGQKLWGSCSHFKGTQSNLLQHFPPTFGDFSIIKMLIFFSCKISQLKSVAFGRY